MSSNSSLKTYYGLKSCYLKEELLNPQASNLLRRGATPGTVGWLVGPGRM
jgi:hypothetical protein